MSNEFNFSNNYDSVYGVDRAPKKKTGAKIAIIAASVLGVAAGGGAAAYNLSPLVKNQVKLRVSSPENYSAWVYSENSETVAKQAADRYRSYIDKLNAGTTVDASLKYEPSAEALDLIKEDINSKEGIRTITETTDISLGISAAYKAGDVTGALKLDRNSDTLLTLDFAVDENPYDLFFRIAELNEKWINIDEQSFRSDSLSLARKRPEEIISPDEFEAEVKRYTDLWNQYTGDVTVEKKEDVAIEDITVSYTVITRTLTPEKIKEYSDAVLEEMKNDELLRTILVDRLGSLDSVDKYNEMIDRAMSEDHTPSSTVQFDTYVDPTGTIRGFRGLEGEEVKVDFVYGISGDQVRGKLVSDEVSATLSATQNGKKYTGNLRVDSDGDIFNIDFTDFEVTSSDFSFFNADAVFRYDDGESGEKSFSAKFTGTEDSQTVAMNVIVDGTDYGKTTLSINERTGAEIQLPDKGAAFYVNTDVSYSDYVSNDEIKAFTESFLAKLGLSEDEAEDLASDLFYGSAYNDYDYDFDEDEFGEYRPATLDDIDTSDYDDEDDDDTDDLFGIDESEAVIRERNTVPFSELADDIIPISGGQAFLFVTDCEGYGNVPVDPDRGETEYVSKGTVVADINGPGTYVVSVNADTESFRRVSGADTDSINMLMLAMTGVKDVTEENFSLDKVTVDGKNVMKDIVNSFCADDESDNPCVILYFNFGNQPDYTLGKNWKNIEATFTIK